ncbi:MAG: hypothetical protein RLZZ22_1408 [Pseudomonadota bacterium]|jgi:benzoate/toluate 1,2-dioxygenase beta subunit
MSITIEQVQAFLFREARLLDDKQFDAWLECYAPDAEYWVPSWDDDNTLTRDPQNEISLIYYANRGGLEDRVFRIKTERSAASMPEPRTGHHLSNIEILEQDAGVVTARFNWNNCCYRYHMTDSYFGRSTYQIDFNGAQPQIRKKHVVIKNDYIHHVIDVICL